MNIGDILQALHLANRQQIEGAAEAQRSRYRYHGKRLGEVLQAEGVCSHADVARALATQTKLRDDPAHANPADVAAIVDYAADLTELAATKLSRKL